VIQYVHEGTITALSEGLRKKQINITNAGDKAKLLSLENAYSTQIAALNTSSYDKQLEKLSLLKNKAHVQHLQGKSNLAMATTEIAINLIQSDPILNAELSVKLLLKDKCYYDVSHQYNTGLLQRELFSTTLQACQAAIDSLPGLLKTTADDFNIDGSFIISEDMKNVTIEMPLVKEPPYRSYVDEDKQGYVNENNGLKTSMITVMPNPAQNRISILAKVTWGVCTINFTDMSGRVVLNKTITLNQNESVHLDLNLNNGIYLYTISNEGNTIDKNKLVILNQE
jgi:hypothetical protein